MTTHNPARQLTVTYVVFCMIEVRKNGKKRRECAKMRLSSETLTAVALDIL